MDIQLKRITQLIQQKGLEGNNQGLLCGNTGLCIFFYHLARTTSNPEYEKIADDLLDNVFACLSALAPVLAPVDFENGLTGIGWGIEYLVQNGFAEGNADEILEEVDNKVFKVLNEETLKSFELTNGLIGYLFYLISRLKNQSNPPSMAQRINRELLILTVNKLDELVTSQFPSIVKEIQFDLFWRFPVMFYGLVEAFKLDIYNEKIRCMVKQWLPNMEAYIPSMHINRLYMATVLTQINELIPHQRLEKQIQILLYATDFEELKMEVDPHALNVRFGWTGFVWVLEQAKKIIPSTCLNYELISSTANEIKLKYLASLDQMIERNIKENPQQIGLANGIAGIGLMELLWPEVFELSNSKQTKQYEEIS
jgi:hypothetical protein